MTSSPVPPLTLDVVRAQAGAAYERFSAVDQASHLSLLSQITGAEAVALEAVPRPGGTWALTVCAADHVGALSLIAGAIAASRLDIVSADLFTLRVPAATRPRAHPLGRRAPVPTSYTTVGRLLDVFEVRPHRHWDPAAWDTLRDEMSALLASLASGHAEEARGRVVDAVSEALRAEATDEARLWPVAVQTSTADGRTLLRISGQDTIGFLFELTNALALLDVNILGGEIRTVDGETRDILAIGGTHGEPLDEARLRQVRAAVALIKQFTALLPLVPDPAQALRQFGALTRQLLAQPDWATRLGELAGGEAQRTLAEVMGVSTFLWEDFLRMQHASLFPLVGDMAALDRRVPQAELRQTLAAALASAAEDTARPALNAFKDREMFRIDLRHITGRIGFRDFAQELSELAEVVVDAAARLAEAAVTKAHGEPRLPNGSRCPWAILALGKFGGGELGFASDIELLFAYAGDGATDGDPPEPNDRFFESWVRAFVDQIATQHEGIFEVDLRLRPHGNAGPLASSVDGLREYYRPDGPAQQFERMALVKLRAVAGDPDLGRYVEALRDAFVYSGAPLDRLEIAHLRARQADELVPAGEVSAKHSPGGVVDIEYWVQARQIEVGAADIRVRTPSTLTALERLVDGGHIPTDLGRETAEAYAFLRRLIDALRVVRGHARDLTIPPQDSKAFAYLARRLELDPEALRSAIDRHMASARALWTPPVSG